MKVYTQSNPLKTPTFGDMIPGEDVFTSKGGNTYMKLNMNSTYHFNAIRLEDGKLVAFNKETKVIYHPNAALILDYDK